MDLDQIVIISNISHFIVATAYLISTCSLFLLRSKIKNIGINFAILGFISLFMLSFLTAFTGHFVGLETLKEIAIYRYLLECISFLIIGIGIFIFSINYKHQPSKVKTE